MADRQKVIDGLELCLEGLSDICPYKDSDAPGGCRDELMHDALVLLKAQGPVEANCEHRCNKCKFYEGVHNVMGHAPCSLWKIGGVMWNDYCSRFNLWRAETPWGS